MSEWGEVINDIQSQLETKAVPGEYLQGFTIYDTDDADEDWGNLDVPWCAIILGGANDDGCVGGARRRRTRLDFMFRFLFHRNYQINGVNYIGDKLMAYIVKKHKTFLQEMQFTTANVTVFERALATTIELGSQEETDSMETQYAGVITWEVTVLDEVL